MSNLEISALKQQISELTDKLNRLERQSKSVWTTIHQAFIDEGNQEDVAVLWADRISEIMVSWANGKREHLGKVLVSTGEMPPYSQCLNDLTIDVSPPGSQPSAYLSLEQPEYKDAPVPPPPPPPTGYSAETSVVPKMQRVYVPKPFSEMELS